MPAHAQREPPRDKEWARGLFVREGETDGQTHRLQSGNLRCPDQNFVLTKRILQLFAIVSPPDFIQPFGKHFKHHHFVAAYVVSALLPKAYCRGAQECRHATKAIGQFLPHLLKVAG